MRSRLLILSFLLATCGWAFAVIQLKLTVSTMYTKSSPVLVAKVTALNESNRVIDADVVDTLVGQAAPTLRLQIIQPQNLFPRVKVGDPIVLFAAKGRGAGDATIHLADAWLIARAKAESNPPIWQITQEQSNDFAKAYPGTTEALVKLVHEFKEGKSPFMEKADERLFGEGATEIAQSKLTPSALFVADLNGDGTSELIISTAHGPRIFAKSGQTYQDAPDTSLPTAGELLAVGDLNADSKPDLLIDNTPYLNQGGSFKAAAPVQIPVKNQLAAVAIADGKIISLSKDGQLTIGSESKSLWKGSAAPLAAVIGPFDESDKPAVIVAFENSLMRYSLDGRAADFPRLTGEPISSYLKESGGQLKNPKLVALDANGDGRRDLLVLSEGSNFLLINRGFGAYFISPGAAQNVLGQGEKKFPYASTATSSHWAAIDTRGDHHEDLLILTPDGTLYRLGNPPPK